MNLVIDYETRSRVDIKTAGMYRYAEDPSTEVLCLAVKADEHEPVLWVPGDKLRLFACPTITSNALWCLVNMAETITAHNSGFEAAIWREIMVKRHGFHPIQASKWCCTAAKAASFALPRSLGMACEALGLSQQKDNAGYRVMMKLCKPNRKGEWNEDPADFAALARYCVADVQAEHELDKALYDLPPTEQKVWQLDQEINDRGVLVDVAGCKNLIGKVAEKETELMLECQALTGGIGPRQVAAMGSWLKGQGVELDTLDKAAVLKGLGYATGPAKRVLEIRQLLGKSSVSKLEAMLAMACQDGRVRGTTLYHGASTGRWSGKGIQPQNLPRDSMLPPDVERVLELDTPCIELLYDHIHPTASRCVRGMIQAKPGHVLLVADFSAIEARVLAWLAGEEKTLKAFREGLDLYKVTASFIYKTPYEKITKRQRQVGKVAVLALGYQGWLGAFTVMAKGYDVEVDEEQAKEIILAWRASNPNIVKFWAGVEKCALQAVKHGKPFAYGSVKYGVRDRFLHCRLPSSRLLSYMDCVPATITTKFGVEKEVLSFMGMDAVRNKWMRMNTYGGSLVENVTQAVARDLLAEAMLRVSAKGYDIVLHCHDEIVAEVPEAKANLKDFIDTMAEVPAWAVGCPIGAEGWVARRYHK